jgi:hypothetical protein
MYSNIPHHEDTEQIAKNFSFYFKILK